MDNKRKLPFSKGLVLSIVFNIILVVIIISLIFNGCINYSSNSPNEIIPQSTYEKLPPLNKNLPAEFNLLNEAWSILNSDYVDKTALDPKKLSQGAVRGMVDALGDRFSGYDDPEAYKRQVESLSGKYQGIGAYVGINKEKRIIIIAPMDNSPAKEAGLKPGDIIVKIDDETTEGMTVEQAAALIKGPAGTSVTLQILREDAEEPIEIKLIRREVNIQSVYYEIKGGDIGYVQLTAFSQTSGDDLYAALNDLKKQKVTGFILDLRNNGGGILNVAVDIISQFQKGGTAVKLADRNRKITSYSTQPFRFVTDLPLVILVNNYSASASEVVAGALQDSGRATIIGKATFGKGSAQIIRNLSDGSAIRITNNLWLTPNERQINDKGLEPDIASELEEEDLIEFAVDYLQGKN